MLLVTGGAGFIGSNFVVSTLAQADEPIVTLDKLSYAGSLMNLSAVSADARHVFERNRQLTVAFVPGEVGAIEGVGEAQLQRLKVALHRRPAALR